MPEVLPLAGQTLAVAGATLSLGIPQVFQLIPAATLDARLVVVKVTRPPLKGGTASGHPASTCSRWPAGSRQSCIASSRG